MPTEICSKPSNCQTPSLIWVVDQDQLNPYVANEGYVVCVPHDPIMGLNWILDNFNLAGYQLNLNRQI